MGTARSVFAAIPVKVLSESKSRLSNLFKPADRGRLTVAMMNDVVKAVASSKAVSEVVVISPDPDVLKIARDLGIEAIPEVESGLNRAVDQVTGWCIRNGGDSVLILPSDIPLVDSEDVEQLTVLGSAWRSVVISPSRDGGTNALLRHPPNAIPPCYGPNSFDMHLSAASSKGIKAKIYGSPRIALDIDSEDDIKSLMEKPSRTLTYRLLEELGFASKMA